MTYLCFCETREQLHRGISSGYEVGKLLLADGKRVRVEIVEDEDSLSAQQRRFFHGPVLTQIAEQAHNAGERYDAVTWKRVLKQIILERNPRWDEIRIPGEDEPRLVRRYWSTEELGVKAYSAFIDESIDLATTSWDVVFRFLPSERDAVRWTGRKKHS